jgi:L-fucose isomerase-like protein
MRGLAELAERLDFVLVSAPTPIEGRDRAADTYRFFDDQELDLLIIHAATCSLADTLMELVKLQVPLALWGSPEPTLEGDVRLNSFVTLQIFASTLRTHFGSGQTDHHKARFKWFYGAVEDAEFLDRLSVTVRALRALSTLRHGHLGLVGDLVPGFQNLSFEDDDLHSRFGVEIARHSIPDVLRSAQGFGHDEVADVRGEMESAARAVRVDSQSLERSARIYLALRQLVQSNGYSALAVRDWPEFQTYYQMSPLLGMAWLTEKDEIPVACEGDALGALCLMMLAAISGDLPTLVDFGPPDLPDGSALLWHLGSSPHRLADSRGVSYEVHSTLGRRGHGGPWGAVVDQVFAPGPVTIANLSHQVADLLVMKADIFARESRGLSGDRGWSRGYRIDEQPADLHEVLNTLLVRGVVHHCAIVRGDWRSEVRELGNWLGLGEIRPIAPSRALQVDDDDQAQGA